MPAPADRAAGTRGTFGRHWLALLLSLAFIFKLVILLQLRGHPLLQPTGEMDSGVYLDLAQRVAGGDLLAGNTLFFVSPFYVYFLAAGLAVSGGSLLVVQLAQIALGTAAVALTAATAGIWYGRRGAVVAAVLVALTGVLTFNEVLILQSAVDPFLTALGLWLLARAWTMPSPSSRAASGILFASGLVLGLHILNRPNIAVWAATALLLAFVAAHGSNATRSGAKPSAAAESGSGHRAARYLPPVALLAGLVLALAPPAIRNYLVAGELAPVSSHGGLNFYIGNNARADGTYHLVAGITPSIAGQARDMRRVAAQATGRAVGDGEASAWFYGQAWGWIRSAPGAALRLFARKLLYVFNAVDLPLNYSYAFYRDEGGTLLWLLFVGAWFLVPVGVAGLWLGAPASLAHREEEEGRGGAVKRAWPRWVSFFPVYALSVAVFFVAGRYRLPLLAALSVPAAGACLALFDYWWARRLRSLVTAAAILAALGIVSNLDLHLDDGRSEERTEMLVYEIDNRQDDAARHRLERTVAESRDPALVLYRAGEAYRERGDAAAAVPLLDRARRLAPEQPAVSRGLGQALLEDGRPADALQYLQPAATRSPGDAALQESVGLALGLVGRRDEAAAALETACRLAPDSPTARLNLAVVYGEMGRVDDARRLAQEALRLRPGYEQAMQLLQALSR